VRLMNDYVVTVSAEYLDPVKDALYCEAAGSPARRSVQTALYEMTRTLATWMAPILCFTAQDVADELSRVTGEPFDVHASVREEIYPPGKAPVTPNKRWIEHIRPQRFQILKVVEDFRASGHKSLDARVFVQPAAEDLPHWQFNLELLKEMCVISQLVIQPSTTANQKGTTLQVDEAPGPTCPRCWRRTGDPATPGAPDPNLCRRCAGALAASRSAP